MTTSNLGRIAVVSQGDWVAGTYKALDIVRYNGAAYIAKVGTSTVPTNTSYWSLLVNDGTPNYTWVKYADDINGTGLSDSPTGKVAIGIAVNKTTATESTTASDYAWSQIRGDTGLAGSSLYTWIKYADDAIGTGLSNTSTGKLYIGIAVNKTSATESTTASDYEWTAIKGDTGTTLYTWIKYADDANGTNLSNVPTGKSYLGIAVNKTTATESTNAGDYDWSLIKGDTGATGATGATGSTGETGVSLYTWIKYGDDAIGTGLSDSPTGKTYIGIAVNKTSATESTTASDYAWSLLGSSGGGGTVTSVAALTLGTTGTDLTSTVATGTTTPVITLNIPDASATARGVLTAADWTTFNSKQAAITFGTNVLTFIGTPSSANLLAAVTDETGSGSLVFNTTPTFVGLRETKVAMAGNDIALATGNYFTKTISGATTLTVSGIPSAGTTASFILDLTNGGSATITWWTVKWVGGTAPTLTTAGRDTLGFFTHDGGTTWTGLVLGKDIK